MSKYKGAKVSTFLNKLCQSSMGGDLGGNWGTVPPNLRWGN